MSRKATKISVSKSYRAERTAPVVDVPGRKPHWLSKMEIQVLIREEICFSKILDRTDNIHYNYVAYFYLRIAPV